MADDETPPGKVRIAYRVAAFHIRVDIELTLGGKTSHPIPLALNPHFDDAGHHHYDLLGVGLSNETLAELIPVMEAWLKDLVSDPVLTVVVPPPSDDAPLKSMSQPERRVH